MSAKKLRANRAIRVEEVRLIDGEGNQLGVIPTADALRKAQEAGLDLVEVSPNADPPVCKILDYGKYLFDQTKKRGKSPQKKAKQQLKEVKFRPNIDIGDYQVKLRMISRFLSAGDKVKVTIRFRGREMMHQHLGKELMTRIKTDVAELGTVEQDTKLEGRQLLMIVAPIKKELTD